MERKIGKLEFVEEGSKVIVEKTFFNFNFENVSIELFHTFKDMIIPIIHGSYNGVRNYTFINNYVVRNKIFSSEISKLTPTYIISNYQLEKTNQKFIKKLSFYSEALEEWIKEDFSLKINDIENTIKIPSDLEVISHQFKSNKNNIQILLKQSQSGDIINLESKKQCQIKIEFENEKTVLEVAEYIRKFQKLILFITNLNPIVKNIYLNDDYEFQTLHKKLESEKFTYNIVPNYKLKCISYTLPVLKPNKRNRCN